MKTTRQLKLTGVLCTAIIATLAASVMAQSPFVRVTENGDLGHLPSNSGAAWGDYDNDGDVDLFVPCYRRKLNHLYRNDGGGVFTLLGPSDIGDLANDDSDSPMGVWADLDNDGHLDLYLAVCTDGSDSNPAPAGRDRIYLNNGETFVRQEPAAFFSPAQTSQCVSLFDYDQDGLLDVLVTTWPTTGGGADVLYHNEDALAFSQTILAPATRGLLGFWGDVDGDGDYDIVVGDFSTSQASVLHMNRAAQGEPGTFVATTTFPSEVILPKRLSDADWGDFDNDGDLDLLAGHSTHTGFDLFRNDESSGYAYLNVPILGGLRAGTVVWVDVDNDGRLDILAEKWDPSKGDQGLAYSYLRSLGGGAFEENVIVSDVESLGDLHLPNPGDFDNDGDMDFFLVVSTQGSNPDQLWQNQSNTNHWLKLVLKGTQSNASGIGAIVRVRAMIDGVETWQMRQVFAGGKYLAQPDSRPNFGLGDATVANVVRIEWPSGVVQELTDISANQILTVVEPPRIELKSATQLAWPVTADGYQLQSSTTVGGPWSPAGESIQTSGSEKRATIQTIEDRKFYRLTQP